MAMEKALLAGGCFWCMVPPLAQLAGVVDVVSGYTGGHVAHPTYQQVRGHGTGHREAVMVTFDPEVVPYRRLLDVYWHQIDPTDDGGQFGDRGSNYRTAIFYMDQRQRVEAERSRDAIAALGVFDKPIVTEILPAGPFYAAEAYHQDYARRHPDRYQADAAVRQRHEFIAFRWQGHDKG